MPKVLDFLRAWPIALVAAVMFAVAFGTSHISLAVTVYGLAKIAAAGYLGYWIDRLLFPYCRPHESWFSADDGEDFAPPLTEYEMETVRGLPVFTPLPQIRRAVIVAACIIAAGLIP